MKKFLLNILYSITSLFKIKNVIILESWPILTDSSLVLYNYLIENKYNDKYKIYWVSSEKENDTLNEKNVNILKIYDKNQKMTLSGAIKYYHYSKNAKYIIYCNRNVKKFNKKSKLIYMNHGLPLKNVKNLKLVSDNVDHILSTSEYVSELLADQLNVDIKKMVNIGFPRNDTFFTYKKDKSKKLSFIDNKKYSKKILWMPTFRTNSINDRNDSTFEYPFGIPILYSIDDIKKLDEKLEKMKTLLLLKLHPSMDASIIKKEKNLKNIKIVSETDLKDNKITLFELYFYVDAFLTDYSSVYYDALLINKPIGFTIDDFEEYNKTRGFPFENPKDKMAGDKIVKLDELIKFIEDINANKDNYKKDREKIRKLFYDRLDGESAKRFTEYFQF